MGLENSQNRARKGSMSRQGPVRPLENSPINGVREPVLAETIEENNDFAVIPSTGMVVRVECGHWAPNWETKGTCRHGC